MQIRRQRYQTIMMLNTDSVLCSQTRNQPFRASQAGGHVGFAQRLSDRIATILRFIKIPSRAEVLLALFAQALMKFDEIHTESCNLDDASM